MKKSILFFTIWATALAGFKLNAQSYQGLTGNFAGVNSLLENPANAADSRYRFDFNFFSVNFLVGSNAYYLNKNKIFSSSGSGFQEGVDYTRNTSDENKNFWMNADILGPSFMMNLNKKSGFGITTRFRTLFNVDNLSNSSFKLIGEDSVGGAFNLAESNLKASFLSFADVGFTYGRVFVDDGRNLFKGGFTLKYYIGVSAGSLNVSNFNATYNSNNNMDSAYLQSSSNGSLNLNYASNIDNFKNGNPFSDMGNKAGKNGFGLDIGFVYERHPSGYYDKDDAITTKWLNSNEKIPYKYKVSVSVTDIGLSNMQFNNSTNAASYILPARKTYLSELNVQNSDPNSSLTMDQYVDSLQKKGILKKNTTSSTFSVALPTVVHVNFDWHAYGRIFINADALISTMGSMSSKPAVHYISTYTLAPRIEMKWLGLYFPFSYNVQKEFNSGFAFRFGPLYVGSGSIISNLVKSNVSNADFYLGLNLPIYRKNNVIESSPPAKP